jgi:hypothetical protein
MWGRSDMQMERHVFVVNITYTQLPKHVVGI